MKKLAAILNIIRCDRFLLATVKDGHAVVQKTMTYKEVESITRSIHNKLKTL